MLLLSYTQVSPMQGLRTGIGAGAVTALVERQIKTAKAARRKDFIVLVQTYNKKQCQLSLDVCLGTQVDGQVKVK